MFRAPDSERGDVGRLMKRIDHVLRENETARLACEDRAEPTDMPVSVLEALQAVVEAMAKGKSITLVPYGEVLTTQQAADLLHVSRPHLIKLLDQGEIPFFRTGDGGPNSHRRVYLDEVLRYREKRNAHRRGKLRELTQLSAQYEGDYR